MSTNQRCGVANDGARCQLWLGHTGHHDDGGYIWAQQDFEPGAEVVKLRAEVAALKRRIRLARRWLRPRPGGTAVGLDDIEDLLDLRRPVPSGRKTR